MMRYSGGGWIVVVAQVGLHEDRERPTLETRDRQTGDRRSEVDRGEAERVPPYAFQKWSGFGILDIHYMFSPLQDRLVSKKIVVISAIFLSALFESLVILSYDGSKSAQLGFLAVALLTGSIVYLFPRRPSPRLYVVFVICFLFYWTYVYFSELIPWKVEAWKLGVYLAITELLIIVFVTLKFATRNFLRLPELLPTAPIDTNEPTGKPLLMHITDVHITRDSNIQRYQGGPGGQGNLLRCLEIVKQLQPCYLLLSGDAVDTGDPVEWRLLEEMRAGSVSCYSVSMPLSGSPAG